MPTCPTCGSSTPSVSGGVLLFLAGAALGVVAGAGGFWFVLTRLIVVQ